jgi:hypothetical protein
MPTPINDEDREALARALVMVLAAWWMSRNSRNETTADVWTTSAAEDREERPDEPSPEQ